MPQQVGRPDQVGRDHGVEERRLELVDAAVGDDAGAADDSVEAAESGQQGVDRGTHRIVVADVERQHRDRRRAQPPAVLGRALERFLPARGQDHVPVTSGQLVDDGQPDTARGAGHEHDRRNVILQSWFGGHGGVVPHGGDLKPSAVLPREGAGRAGTRGWAGREDIVTATDAVVIGSGPNGLVAANLLVDAGWSVVVLEEQDRAGGAVQSDDAVAPGYVHDTFSSFYPLAAGSPTIRGLGLEQHGLEWVQAPSVVGPLLPGRSLGRAAP